jgi:hypothetical protein
MKPRALMLPPPLLSCTHRRLQRSSEKVNALACSLCEATLGSTLENEQRYSAAQVLRFSVCGLVWGLRVGVYGLGLGFKAYANIAASLTPVF